MELTKEISTKLSSFDPGNLLFMASFDVPYHAVKKNSRPIKYKFRKGGGRQAFIGKSPRLENMEYFFKLQFGRIKRQMKIESPITDRVWMMVHFHFPQNVFFTKKGPISQKLPDLSNLYEIVQDCLQKSGVIANDSLIDSHDGSRRIPGDKYKIEIFLMKYCN